MAEFKREKVLFHVVGQGEIEVEYEVGAETPEEAFRRAYDESVAGITKLMIRSDVEFVTTVATEPVQGKERCGVPHPARGYPCSLLTGHRYAHAASSRYDGTTDLAWPQDEQDDPDWESRINWTNRSDVELEHHLTSDHDFVVTHPVTRTELNLLHDRIHDIKDRRESDEYARAREDEADQWRMNR